MRLARVVGAAVVLSASFVSGCILSPLDLENRECPCAPGWRCNSSNHCVVLVGRACMTRTDCMAGELCTEGMCMSYDGGPPCIPEAESCDGNDDDCDTRIDEGTGLCSLPEAVAACVAGACAVTSCQAGFEDCDDRATNGCETPLGTTVDCGACGETCTGTTPFCAPGAGGALGCVENCPSTLTECDGACVETDTDRHHCGACDVECSFEHATGRCVAGACSLSVCDARWSDCNTDEDDGCETSLDADTSCGTCTTDCTGSSVPATCTVGRCIGGACTTVSGPGVTCRPAVSICDEEEVCTAGGTCPPDRVAMSGVACRASACGGLDPRELCDGVSATCPPPCGCEGEPCCEGATECNVGLECRMDVCRACTPAPVMLGGGFPMPAGMGIPRRVMASGSTITISDGMSVTGAITLGTGITATGSVVGACMAMQCDWVTSVTASGSTLTLTTGGISGMPAVVGTITLTGATATGSFTAMPVFTTIPGYFQSLTVSGDTMTLTDTVGTVGTIRLTRTSGACP